MTSQIINPQYKTFINDDGIYCLLITWQDEDGIGHKMQFQGIEATYLFNEICKTKDNGESDSILRREIGKGMK